MTGTRKAYLLLFIIQVTIMGGFMFVFYYFVDEYPLLISVRKAISFGIIITILNMFTTRFLKKKYEK